MTVVLTRASSSGTKNKQSEDQTCQKAILPKHLDLVASKKERMIRSSQVLCSDKGPLLEGDPESYKLQSTFADKSILCPLKTNRW